MGKKSDPPPAPDYGPLISAYEKSADQSFELSKEQFEWAKQAYAENKEVVDATTSSFLDAMEFNNENARKDRARYESVYQPLEDSLIAEYEDYASPERIAKEQGAAIAGVGQQFEAARQNAQRSLEDYGINPSDTRYGALDIGVRLAEAGAKAAASDTARREVENTQRALRSEALNIGRGYPAQGIAYGQEGRAGGTSANAGALDLTQTGGATMGTAPGYIGAGNNALGGIGSTMNTQYGNQLDRYEAEQNASTGIGAILGAGAGMFQPIKLFNRGGPVRKYAGGGAIPDMASPSKGINTDDVDIKANAGEFVIPEEAVRWFGEKHMHNLIEKAHKEMAEVPQQSGAIPDVAIPANRGPAALPLR